MNSTKERTVVTSVEYPASARGERLDVVHSIWIQFVMGTDRWSSSGVTQGFGGIALDQRTGPALRDEVCQIFGVKSLIDIVGKKCFVLRSWPHHNEVIEGFEYGGRRFTLTRFRRRMWPEMEFDVFRDRHKTLIEERERLLESIRRVDDAIKQHQVGYVDWSKDE